MLEIKKPREEEQNTKSTKVKILYQINKIKLKINDIINKTRKYLYKKKIESHIDFLEKRIKAFEQEKLYKYIDRIIEMGKNIISISSELQYKEGMYRSMMIVSIACLKKELEGKNDEAIDILNILIDNIDILGFNLRDSLKHFLNINEIKNIRDYVEKNDKNNSNNNTKLIEILNEIIQDLKCPWNSNK